MFSIRFSATEFFSTVRRKHFTQIEIFAFVGGLLGLFLGFSVLSFAEIIYFIIFESLKKIRTRKVSPNQGVISNERIGLVLGYWLSFMKNSSVHSFMYIADVTRSKLERITWMISFLLSMIGCVLMIANLYKKLNFDLISIVVDDEVCKISQIPFPSVTIFGDYPLPQFADSYQNFDFVRIEGDEGFDSGEFKDLEFVSGIYGKVKTKPGFILK